MTYQPYIPEGLFPVKAFAPAITAGLTGDYLCLKNVQMCWVYLFFADATAHQDAITIERAHDVAGTDTAVIINAVPIWYGVVSATSSQLTRQTDAVNFTTTADVTGDKIVIFQIDPASLGGTFDCITVKVANTAHATNYCAATYWVLPRYPEAVASRPALEFIQD